MCIFSIIFLLLCFLSRLLFRVPKRDCTSQRTRVRPMQLALDLKILGLLSETLCTSDQSIQIPSMSTHLQIPRVISKMLCTSHISNQISLVPSTPLDFKLPFGDSLHVQSKQSIPYNTLCCAKV